MLSCVLALTSPELFEVLEVQKLTYKVKSQCSDDFISFTLKQCGQVFFLIEKIPICVLCLSQCGVKTAACVMVG